ncbi:hypothetical protein SDC9_117194 [bioreactor metagenome]|uniref:Uncharacterized protein n=1 Tax=bioreactor metagenome TaxID=1076179 RepID=A0A645BZX2_9ZZZZ
MQFGVYFVDDAGSEDDLILPGVIEYAFDFCHFLHLIVIDRFAVLHLQAQTRRAVGSGDDIIVPNYRYYFFGNLLVIRQFRHFLHPF